MGQSLLPPSVLAWTVLADFMPSESIPIFLDIRDEFQLRFPTAWENSSYLRFCLKDVESHALDQLRAKAQIHLGIADGKVPWDSFLLVFPSGTSCPEHVDKPERREQLGRRQERLNILLQAPASGGELYIQGNHVPLRQGDACLFHPGVQLHEVRPVLGERLVLSFGAWKL